ncbi:DUF1643 domain-containing protein [Bacillus circulans]|uniref:DUF1643 domain-containing protein n=1 Tax=Niallia circulans TaxID=1397 RepID=UPI00155FC0BA|nr:DUF1643 domain-containing protein [Niallia circulans]NRG28812.1 DUF1643 domain-containing protein [Niallia circulans]
MSKPYNSTYVDKVIECEVENLIDNIDGRYLLKIKLRNNFTNTLTIVMMNPSKANELCSDDTVDKVISFVFQMNSVEDSLIKNIGFINIVNIFPAYEPNSKELNDILEVIIGKGKFISMQSKNRITFEKALAESQYVVLAWGDVPSKVNVKNHTHEVLMMYNLLVKYILLDNTYVLKYREYEQILTNKKRPRHPGRKTPKSYVKPKELKLERKFLYILV